MKKILFLLLIIFTGCQSEEFGYTEQEIAYKKAFVNQFGKPNNSNFGFQDLPIFEITRTVNTESNLWDNYYGLNVPENVSSEEADYVYNWFSTHQLEGKGEVIHWSDFFVQYVAYSGIGSMDQLGCEYLDGTWEHINDFNTSVNSTKWVYAAGTENWTYRASHSDTYQYDKYYIKYLSFEVNGVHYEGYYIGFDYQSIKQDSGDKYADGYYNDWIIKITPGVKVENTARVMCEDLGNSYDWDFNDVVFDVSYTRIYYPKNALYATIIIRAVGGTLPIYLADYDLHSLIGEGPQLHPTPVILTLEVESSNPKDIPIYVRDTYATWEIQNTDVPQKFMCPDYVEWAEEEQNICNKYPNVADWWINGSTYNIWKTSSKKRM